MREERASDGADPARVPIEILDDWEADWPVGGQWVYIAGERCLLVGDETDGRYWIVPASQLRAVPVAEG